jgi:gamma-glutamyltranspeptidase
VIGSSGSERIQSAVFQVLTALGRGVSPFAAVHAPRLHATPESVIRLEATRFDTTVGPALRSAGFTLRDVGPYAFFVGAVQLVVRTSAGQFIGAADPRRDGAAFGPGEPGEPGGGAAVATDRRT